MTTPRQPRPLRLLLALMLLMLAPLETSAQSDGDRLGIGLRALVKGREKPAIVLTPREKVKKLAITLERSDGKTIKLKSGVIRPGKKRSLSFNQPQGVFEYQATFEVTWAKGLPSRFQTTFSATRTGELKLDMGSGDVDMDERHMRFRITNPAKSAKLIILGERGRRLDVVTVDYEGAPPGQDLELDWDPVEGSIVRMDLEVTDITGFWVGMQILPFHIEIPHDDVVFETGKHNVRDSEAPKLESTMGFIRKAFKEHGTLLELKLFVAGYTDTVGSRTSNQALSERRARSIAGWFRTRGLSVPIYYQGFGEDVLAKPTPDETPEQANRRALYFLASQFPTGSNVPGASWKAIGR